MFQIPIFVNLRYRINEKNSDVDDFLESREVRHNR